MNVGDILMITALSCLESRKVIAVVWLIGLKELHEPVTADIA